MRRCLRDGSQTSLLLKHFDKDPSISGIEAWSIYRMRSLSRRIVDLQERGYRFSKEEKKDPNGQRYVRYHFLGKGA